MPTVPNAKSSTKRATQAKSPDWTLRADVRRHAPGGQDEQKKANWEDGDHQSPERCHHTSNQNRFGERNFERVAPGRAAPGFARLV